MTARFYFSYAPDLDPQTMRAGVRQLIQDLIEQALAPSPLKGVWNPADDQARLAAAIQEVVTQFHERCHGRPDRATMIKSLMAAAWQVYQDMDDDEWEAKHGGLEPLIEALRSVCEPHDGLNNDDEVYAG